jgi:hypothetical protein
VSSFCFDLRWRFCREILPGLDRDSSRRAIEEDALVLEYSNTKLSIVELTQSSVSLGLVNPAYIHPTWQHNVLGNCLAREVTLGVELWTVTTLSFALE